MTYKLFPLAKNKVLARFENLADRFDPGISSVEYIDVREFAANIYKEANPSAKQLSPTITETRIDTSKNNDGKTFRWRGSDDQNITLKYREHPKDSASGIALEP